MPRKVVSHSGFIKLRALFALTLCSVGLVMAMFSFAGMPWHSSGSPSGQALADRPRYMPVRG